MTFASSDNIVIENMVYGALSYSRKGQQVVGRSKGITPETEQEIVGFCNSWGDCRNLNFKRSLNQFPLKSVAPDGRKLIAVVKVINSGRDQVGREGSLIRHALMLAKNEYRWLEYNPFLLESLGIFLTVWTRQSDCRAIHINRHAIPPSDLAEIPQYYYDALFEYLHVILSGGRIYYTANNHVRTAEEIIYYLMKLLPLEIKSEIAMTTFAFRKNLEYRIGCFYRSSSVPADPLKVIFETTGERTTEVESYLEELFAKLKSERFGGVIRMLTNPLPFKN